MTKQESIDRTEEGDGERGGEKFRTETESTFDQEIFGQLWDLRWA